MNWTPASTLGVWSWAVDGCTGSGSNFHNLDGEEDFTDEELDDPLEADRQPARLDVFPQPLFVGARNHD